jgi:hypothetical protein
VKSSDKTDRREATRDEHVRQGHPAIRKVAVSEIMPDSDRAVAAGVERRDDRAFAYW